MKKMYHRHVGAVWFARVEAMLPNYGLSLLTLSRYEMMMMMIGV